MKVRVAARRCIGCGCCEDICPELFVVRARTAVTRAWIVPQEAEGFCLAAMGACPRAAIELKNLLGGLFPEWTSCNDEAAHNVELAQWVAAGVKCGDLVAEGSRPVFLRLG